MIDPFWWQDGSRTIDSPSGWFIRHFQWESLAGLKREQGQTQAAHLRQDAMERSLILESTKKQCGALFLLHYFQSLKPFLPGWIKVSFDAYMAFHTNSLFVPVRA